MPISRRSGWAVLAAGALVASLFAVGAAPAAAVTDKADHEADTSACVGDALKDHMFTDVGSDHFHADAINCVAYYGITNGTGDGSTYSPNSAVTRAQMAVFIARAAGVAGVDLDDPMGDAFTDIGDTWSDAQDAINSLAESGIIASGGAFRPDDDITRAEMATFLVGLLVEASDNVKISDDRIRLSVDPDEEGPADDYFGDARAALPRANDAEVSAIYELGVTKGASAAAGAEDGKDPLDFNYEPHGTVTRGQMAAFITRAMAHTSARPAGVTAQALSNNVVRVSVRDENFKPVSNAWVEAFSISTPDADDAFNSNGECGGSVVSSEGAERLPCDIDGADLLTDIDGDAETQAITVGDDGAVAWTWTGDVGDEVDSDTTLYRLELSKGAPDPKISDTAHISNDLAGARAKIGSSATVTLQLQKDGDDVAGGALDADRPAQWMVRIETFTGDGDISSATPIEVDSVKVKSDSDGKGTFVLASPADPDPNARGQAFTMRYTVSVDIAGCVNNGDGWDGCDAPHADDGTHPSSPPTATVTDGAGDASGDNIGTVVFTDEVAKASKVEIDTAAYVEVASRAGRSAFNRATVTVTDQYGDPVRGAKVTLTSDLGRTDDTTDTDGGASSLTATIVSSEARQFTTGSRGSYTFGYTYTSTVGDQETITATHDPTPDDDTDTSPTDTADVNWAQEGSVTQETAEVVAGDVDANQIVVVNGGVPSIVTYDDDDRFNTSDGALDAAAPASMAAFEKKLAAFLATEVFTDENVVWSNYRSGPRNTSVFTLHES